MMFFAAALLAVLVYFLNGQYRLVIVNYLYSRSGAVFRSRMAIVPELWHRMN